METDPRFDVMLDANDPDFVEQLRAALGIAPGETLTITTPQFERTDGRVIGYFPRTAEEFAALHKLPAATLKKMGLGVWEAENDKTHWLFPKEWYWNIPNGTPVACISGKVYPFVPGETDDDIRFGCLAYGFIQDGAAAIGRTKGNGT